MASLTASLVDGNERFEGEVPVPLHRARLAKRGFNQVAWMARAGHGEDKRACFG
jgi:predicted amidophosphoribosyltransferase